MKAVPAQQNSSYCSSTISYLGLADLMLQGRPDLKEPFLVTFTLGSEEFELLMVINVIVPSGYLCGQKPKGCLGFLLSFFQSFS